MGSIEVSLSNDGAIVNDRTAFNKAFTQRTKGSKPQVVQSVVLHRSLHHQPLRAIRAEGNYLTLDNGQTVFDATGGAAVACLGHGNKRCVWSPAMPFDLR